MEMVSLSKVEKVKENTYQTHFILKFNELLFPMNSLFSCTSEPWIVTICIPFNYGTQDSLHYLYLHSITNLECPVLI